MILSKEDVLKRLCCYIRQLFAHIRSEKPDMAKSIDDLPIMKDEVKAAVTKWKVESTEPDNISSEKLKVIVDWGIEQLAELLNAIYVLGEIPIEMCKSIFIKMPKRPGSNQCEIFREKISSMSHITKIMLSIIWNWVRNKIKPEISKF